MLCPALLLLFVSFTYTDDVYRFHHFSDEFEFHSIKLSWFDANTYCQIRFGHLVTVENASTQDLLWTVFLNRPEVIYEDYWIGLHKAQSGPWRWTGDQIFIYNNWFYRPKQVSNSPLCAKMIAVERLGWTHSDCIERNGFICQYQSKATGLQDNITELDQLGATARHQEETFLEQWMIYTGIAVLAIITLLLLIICCLCCKCNEKKHIRPAPSGRPLHNLNF